MAPHIWYLGKCVYCECAKDSAEAATACPKRKRVRPDHDAQAAHPEQRRIEYPRGGD